MLLIRTTSQMCGRWYLPMFLLRDGLLTLMNIDSLISLLSLCSSPPIILKLFNVILWPEVLQWSWIGEGAFRCSLYLSPNVLAVSPMYSSSHSNPIYRYKCDRLECDEEYIGETARTFGERYKEHLKAPSPIHDHCNTSGHNITLNDFSIMGREEHNLNRLIKESMFIRVNNPSLNKNICKYHLPHIWDVILINNIELKLK